MWVPRSIAGLIVWGKSGVRLMENNTSPDVRSSDVPGQGDFVAGGNCPSRREKQFSPLSSATKASHRRLKEAVSVDKVITFVRLPPAFVHTLFAPTLSQLYRVTYINLSSFVLPLVTHFLGTVVAGKPAGSDERPGHTPCHILRAWTQRSDMF